MASYIDPSFRESLLKKPQDRTAQDLTLINANLKSLEALSSLRDTTIRSLCKTVKYVKHEANDVLYRTGDVISCWYILLSGSVFIDGSMFLPRSGFGRRSTGQLYRIHDCLVLETSEMLVIEYPSIKQPTAPPIAQDQHIDTANTNQMSNATSNPSNNFLNSHLTQSNASSTNGKQLQKTLANGSASINNNHIQNGQRIVINNHYLNNYEDNNNSNSNNTTSNYQNNDILNTSSLSSSSTSSSNKLVHVQNNSLTAATTTSMTTMTTTTTLVNKKTSCHIKNNSISSVNSNNSAHLTTFKTIANSSPNTIVTKPIIVNHHHHHHLNHHHHHLNHHKHLNVNNNLVVDGDDCDVDEDILNNEVIVNKMDLLDDVDDDDDDDDEDEYDENDYDGLNVNTKKKHELNVFEHNLEDEFDATENNLENNELRATNNTNKSICIVTGNARALNNKNYNNKTSKQLLSQQQRLNTAKKITSFQNNSHQQLNELNLSQQTINSSTTNANNTIDEDNNNQLSSLIISNTPSSYPLATTATIINDANLQQQQQQQQQQQSQHTKQMTTSTHSTNLKKNTLTSRSSSSISSKSSSIISNNNNQMSSNLLINNSNLLSANSYQKNNNLSTCSGSINNDDGTSEQSIHFVKDSVREILEKEPKERTDEDIDILFEFMQSFPAFSDLTQPIIRKLCACMVLGVVDKADTIVLEHNEKLDSWAVVLNGQVECTLPDNQTVKTYNVGDHFGVQATLDAVLNEGVMRTKCDDCQFVLVKQNDYYDILNQSKENTRAYYENGKVCMITEYRLLNSTSDRQGEILLRATADKLIERLVIDDANSILDPTYIQDFLLTYRVFIDSPMYISNKLFEFFQRPNINGSSNQITSSPSLNHHVVVKKKVYRIVLEWITNHFNDFETHKELYDFVEMFQDTLNKENMNEQFRVLTIAISTKSKPRTVTLARSKRDENLMFNIQGGWDKGYGVFISKVDKDSKAYELGIRKGDQILEVNGHSFQHITLASAIESLKSFTHLSISLKYNPIGFNEILLHPEKSPHRNKKNFINNNKAYLIEYLQMQQNNFQEALNESSSSLGKGNTLQSPRLQQKSLSTTDQTTNQQAKKSIGSMPPLPPSSSSSAINLTPRNKSKDTKHNQLKLLQSNSNLTTNGNVNLKESNTNQIRKILGRFNKKSHSKDLESLQPVDSSAPALKSITRSPSPSLSNFTSTSSFAANNGTNNKLNSRLLPNSVSMNANNVVNNSLTTSDYSSNNLSRNNSSNNLSIANQADQQGAIDTSLAKMSLQDQQQFVGEHVLKIYKNDQTFKYLVVHKETSTKEVVMLALNEFNIIDDIGSNAYSLCEVSVDQDRLIKQKRLPDQMNNLAEKLPLNARYYLKSNISPEQFLNDAQSVEELIKDSNITFLQLCPLELSAQLTLRDYCIFKSIESSEYIDFLFKKNSKYGFAHLNQFSDLSNEEMFWVINEILHESSLMRRAKIIKHFIQIAHICKECKNYNSLFAILSGLDHMSVTRLKDTWDKVSNKYKKTLQDLKLLLDPSFNMVKYRQMVKNESIQPPIIPFFPICQKDLFFIKELGETTADGLVNFEKMRKLSKSVRSIVQMTTSSFDLTSMRDVPTSHSVIFSMFGCTNQSLISDLRSGYHITKLNIRADHVKKLYEESVMVRKVRHYLNTTFKNIEKNEERLRLISSTLEHSTSGNTLKRKPSPNSSLGGSVSSINALNNSSHMHNTSNGSSIGANNSSTLNGIAVGHHPKPTLFGAHSPDAVKKLLALSENTKVKTVKTSSSYTSVPLSHLASSNTSNNTRHFASNHHHHQNHHHFTNSSSTNGTNVNGIAQSNTCNALNTIASSSPTLSSPKPTNQRSVSSSQPLNNKYNYSIPLSSESSSVSTIKLNGKYTSDSYYSQHQQQGSSSSSINAKLLVNHQLATNGNNQHNIVVNSSETDSGRASMASNVDQDQCSPTFQQRAFILNRYMASEHNQQQPIIKSMSQSQKQTSEMYVNRISKNGNCTSTSSSIVNNGQTTTNQKKTQSESKNEEEQDQVSAV